MDDQAVWHDGRRGTCKPKVQTADEKRNEAARLRREAKRTLAEAERLRLEAGLVDDQTAHSTM